MLSTFFPRLDTTYHPIISETAVNENYRELMDRASYFITELIKTLDNNSPDIDTILLVTHAATKIALGRALLKDEDAEIRTGVCSLDTYVRSDKNTWIAKTIGETHFLAHGEEMHWDFGMFFVSHLAARNSNSC